MPKAVGGESRWIGIEVTINNTAKIIVSAHIFHTSDFHSVSSQQHWKSQTLWEGGFRSTKCLTGLDANAKLASHSDGFRVGNAVPNSDMTAGDEERTTFFVNFMAKERAGRAKHSDSGSSTTSRNVHKEKSGTDTRYWAISQLEHRWARF